MSDEMKKMLEEYLKRLLTTADQGVQWTADQIPLVIQEKLNYDLWQAVFWVAFGLLIMIAGWTLCARLKVWAEKVLPKSQARGTDQNDITGLRVVLRIASTVVGLAFILGNAGIVIKITVAPRLYILEWLRGLV